MKRNIISHIKNNKTKYFSLFALDAPIDEYGSSHGSIFRGLNPHSPIQAPQNQKMNPLLFHWFLGTNFLKIARNALNECGSSHDFENNVRLDPHPLKKSQSNWN